METGRRASGLLAHGRMRPWHGPSTPVTESTRSSTADPVIEGRVPILSETEECAVNARPEAIGPEFR